MKKIEDANWQRKIKKETQGFTYFKERRPRVGQERVFVYPNFGTPDSHPDYTAHRFAIVTVAWRVPDAENESGEP